MLFCLLERRFVYLLFGFQYGKNKTI